MTECRLTFASDGSAALSDGGRCGWTILTWGRRYGRVRASLGAWEANEGIIIGTVANVRERLMTLFGDAAKLVLENKAGCGVSALLELPK